MRCLTYMNKELALKIFTEFKDFGRQFGIHHIWKVRGKKGIVDGRNNYGSELSKRVQNSYGLP